MDSGNCEVQVHYHRHVHEDEPYGRFYASCGMQQAFTREIRAVLAHRNYFDLDMVNAHPAIAVTNFPELSQNILRYMENRETYLRDVLDEHPKVDRDAICSSAINMA